jgi:hypothetical protein
MSTRISPYGNKRAFRPFQKSMLDGGQGFRTEDEPLSPQFQFSSLRENASFLFERLSLTQNVMYYEFKGFPLYDQSWKKCRMLYYRGSLVTFLHKDKLYTLPFTFDSHLNSQGFPVKIRPIPYSMDQQLPDDMKNIQLTVGVDCALLMDHAPFGPNYHIVPRSVDNSIINNIKAEALTRVQMSMVSHFKKHVISVLDEATASKTERKLLQCLESDNPIIALSNLFTVDKQVFDGAEYVGPEYFRTIKDLQALQDLINGISTSGFGTDKNERLVAGELMGVIEQVDIIHNVRKRFAQLYCEDCNRIFGLNTSVDFPHFDRVKNLEINDNFTLNNKTKNSGMEPSVDKGGNE